MNVKYYNGMGKEVTAYVESLLLKVDALEKRLNILLQQAEEGTIEMKKPVVPLVVVEPKMEEPLVKSEDIVEEENYYANPE